MTQKELVRGYQQGGQNPVHDTFDIPRQWWIFTGRLTKPYEYYVAIQNGLDQLDRGESIPNEELKRQLASWLTS